MQCMQYLEALMSNYVRNVFIIFILGICAIFAFSAIFFGCYSIPKIGLSIIYQLFIDDEKKQGKFN